MTQRAIPDDNLGYPVLISLTDCGNNFPGEKASGLFLTVGPDFYLATARHVLLFQQLGGPLTPVPCKKAELSSYSRNPKEAQQNRLTLDLEQLRGAGKIKWHPTHDVALIQIGSATAAAADHPGSLSLLPGAHLDQLAPSGLLSANVDTGTRKLDDVLVSNDAYVLGYPSSIGFQQPQVDYTVPLLRKGIIAGVNNANKTIVLDCMTFQGNSGGPVLEAIHSAFENQIYVVGLISQWVPVPERWDNTTFGYFNIQLHNSGYSIAEPMDPILELVGR
jgi:hypothetical protein